MTHSKTVVRKSLEALPRDQLLEICYTQERTYNPNSSMTREMMSQLDSGTLIDRFIKMM